MLKGLLGGKNAREQRWGGGKVEVGSGGSPSLLLVAVWGP